jgi:hypothetical protein
MSAQFLALPKSRRALVFEQAAAEKALPPLIL